jgi:hypothetical protein
MTAMTPDCYLLCNDGNNLMPCKFEGFDERGLAILLSPNGAEYTANPGHMVTCDDAADMFRDQRANKMVTQGYVIMHLQGSRWHVWHPGKHGANGEDGYEVTLGDFPTCRCEDFKKRQGKPCKHIKGAPDLIRFAQVQKPTLRVPAKLRPVGSHLLERCLKAQVAAETSAERLARMRDEDGF